MKHRRMRMYGRGTRRVFRRNMRAIVYYCNRIIIESRMQESWTS